MTTDSGVDAQRFELFRYLLGLGDDALILGHRLSEWCGHAPVLEEDIALANIALDCLGHAAAFLDLAAAVEQKERSADDLAFFRDAVEFRNCTIVELPNGDFARTMVRQFLVDTYRLFQLDGLAGSNFSPLAAFAAKAVKEVRYHFRHSSAWVIRLGDGTPESHQRTQQALDELWPYIAELLEPPPEAATLVASSLIKQPNDLEERWHSTVAEVLSKAQLTPPAVAAHRFTTHGRRGLHTEHLGHLLAEMQSVARSAPGAAW